MPTRNATKYIHESPNLIKEKPISGNMAKLISTNPAKNYEVVGEVTISTPQEIQKKVQQANQVKKAWKELGVKKRAELLGPICEEFKQRKDEIARLIVQETGKTIRNARLEVAGYCEEFEWFMQNAPNALAETITFQDKSSIHKITYEPHGVAAVISPWNFPFGMAIWGIIPNLLAGNTVVFKISEECPLLGKLIEEVFNSHNLPQGVFSEIYGAGDIGQALAESNIDLIWFTGSSKTGKLLYKIAAEKFIKVILELGGSNPCIIFADVDINRSAQVVYDNRFYHCGQSCDAIKRLIVHESIFDRFVEELKSIIETKKISDPFDKEADFASLVAKRQIDLLEQQVEDAKRKGAIIHTGGKRPANLKGAYYNPTLLTNITTDMRVWKEEVFGPVLPIVSFKTEEEAITLANDTMYGLGSRVISQDIERARRIASKIEAGTVEINYASRWLLCNPFGGYKQSGVGCEHGLIGFQELSQIKVISEKNSR